MPMIEYADLACDICASHVPGLCDNCHLPFVPGEVYKSVSHHFHPGSVGSVPGYLGLSKSLCKPCMAADRARVYPNEIPAAS